MLQLKSAHVFALITGASRGFGRSIAKQFLAQVLPHHPATVTLNLHASPASQTRLDELKGALHADAAALLPNSECALRINTVTLDLRYATLKQANLLLRRDAADGAVGTAVLFSNAGVLHAGRLDSGVPAGPDGALSASLAVNTVAASTIMSAFLQTFTPPTHRVLAYTSTLAIASPFVSWPAYCASKAATEMLHRVAAAEHPDARVLLYAPGPMRTDMVGGAVSDTHTDAGLKHVLETGAKVDPDESAAKMVRLLVQDEYENATHIDFFDS